MKWIKQAWMIWLGAATIVLADTPPAPQPPAPILAGRPDANVSTDGSLGEEFSSLAAGVAFKPPVNGQEIRHAVGGDEIVRFVYDQQKWQLKVSRMVLTKPAPIITDTEKDQNGIIRQGLLETMAEQLKVDTGGAEILRQDPINVVNLRVGMIAARYSVGKETYLTQRAIVQGDEHEQLYYLFDFTTPAPRTGSLDQDPATKRAVDLFGHVVESIRLLDQSQLIKNQNERLFFTKALYLSDITEPKMRKVLMPERWLRLIQDGKDIGYMYVIEEVASGLPHKGEPAVVHAGNVAGIRVGVRSRTYPAPGVQRDSESWSWVAMDRKQEEWSNLVYVQNSNETDPKLKKITSSESGVTIWRIKPVKAPMMNLPDNKGIGLAEDYKLSVTRGGVASRLSETTTKDLPPFYLPKALDHLLPRLVPRGEPKGFMFATYVSDQKELVRRYIDVGREGEFVLAGKKIDAVPVTDRVGLEGPLTTHYISPEGEYLGSINLESKMTILPSDADTIGKMWKDANLSRPGEVEVPGAAVTPPVAQ